MAEKVIFLYIGVNDHYYIANYKREHFNLHAERTYYFISSF